MLEFTAVILLIYGYTKEEKFIQAEQDIRDIYKACKAQHIGPLKLYRMYKERYK
nr:MAG TPA: hypothetical protein [Caudoviricetes sp.]